ncbi:MAG: hypothetical protein M0C28_30125 [Candidatus Moduliflexus flocculans]|nr:hypothetical protein [Candidatus Moduliflexus flocculans]
MRDRLRLERIPTTDPRETLDHIIRFFRARASEGLPIRALGVGCFGPVDLDPASPRWGFINLDPEAAGGREPTWRVPWVAPWVSR